MSSMDTETRKLFETALMLPEDEREALAAALLASLDDPLGEADAEESWKIEVRRRLHELDSGSVSPIPWEAARRTIFAP